VLLRVRGEDVTLTGDWSAPVEYMMPYTLADHDGDRMADAWEILHFGSTNSPAGLPEADPDGDGQNNLAEYLCGTHPDDWNSCLRIFSISQESGDHINIAWQTAGGKTNRVQAALTPGGVYENISPAIIISGSGDRTNDWTELSGATNTPARFYRIWLEP
jgi:hypothetical protein